MTNIILILIKKEHEQIADQNKQIRYANKRNGDKFKSKLKGSFTSNKSNNNSPTMYKIAMRLKKFTETKRLISTQSESSGLDQNNNNLNDSKNDILEENELNTDRRKHFNRSCEFDLGESPSIDFNISNYILY